MSRSPWDRALEALVQARYEEETFYSCLEALINEELEEWKRRHVDGRIAALETEVRLLRKELVRRQTVYAEDVARERERANRVIDALR